MVVFVLCTALVVGVVVVLNYEAVMVGNQTKALPKIKASCSSSDPTCPHFSIISASVGVENTSDLLGVASPAYLSLVFNVSGATPLASIRLFIGNVSAGAVSGPFGLGLNQIVNLTLPSTVIVYPGRSYPLSVEGLNGNGAYVVITETVTAETQAPYAQ